MKLLSVENLTICFGGLTAVDDVSFHVEPGQIYAIIGPNGAGKTTVFNAVTGVYDPTSGKILLQGRLAQRPFTVKTVLGMLLIGALTAVGFTTALNIQGLWDAGITSNYVYQQAFPWGTAVKATLKYLIDQSLYLSLGPALFGAAVGISGAYAVWSRARRSPDVIAGAHVARTFQNIRLFQQMTVLENVLVGMDTGLRTRFWHAALRLPLFQRERRESEAKAMEILRFVELDREAHAVAAGLAYGFQRRLEIARALGASPKLLLLDEPAAGMNPSESADLMDLIRKIRDTGISILLIEHDMKVVMGVSDRITVLDYGNKIAEGTPQEIKTNAQVKKAYLGTAEV